MTIDRELARGQLALYAVGAVAGAALATSGLLLWSTGISPGMSLAAALPPALLLGCIGLASRFLCRAMPLRSAGRNSIVAALTGSAVAASSLWILAWKSWLPVLNRMERTTLSPDFSLLFGLGLLLYLATIAVHYLVLEIDASREAEETALRYRVLAREAELRAFKAQVDPHFLFNSLNAVASLCGSRPGDAREMATKLAEFFRLILRLGSRERIALSQEIDLVSSYLAIEKVRFGDRLNIRIDVDDEAASWMIPPLLLQPLIENSVRHGIASMLEGGTISVSAAVREGLLRIRVDNPADPDRADVRGEGVGLENAQGRLAAISDGRARMESTEKDGRFIVHMELPR